MNRFDVPASLNPNVLPPDVAEARRTRINEELIGCFGRRKGAMPPSAQGIGLYTHIQGLARAPLYPREKNIPRTGDPEYLPIGGPRDIERDHSLETETSAEVKKLWAEVKNLVREEEAMVPAGTSVEKLNERYGALDAPKFESQLQRSLVEERDMMVGGTRNGPVHPTTRKTTSSDLQTSGGRPSLGAGMSGDQLRGTEDVVMGGTMERAAATKITMTGNTYEASRDPRQRR